ncbi:MAG: hypothetical protein FWD99_02970 [Oscillospiraceae bacterium]|nr:hypothetical protein [Oscillospiraceae bacterium]
MAGKMKRLRLMGLHAERDDLLRRLMGRGCVELAESRGDEETTLSKQESDLPAQKERLDRLNQALDILQRIAPEKKRLFPKRDEVSEDVLFCCTVTGPALELADDIAEKEAQINQRNARINQMEAERVALLPWREMNIPLGTQGTEHVAVEFGTVPRSVVVSQLEATLLAEAPAAALYLVGQSKEQLCLMLICYRAELTAAESVLREAGFARVILTETDTPDAEIDRISNEMADIQAEIAALREELAHLADKRPVLKLCADRLALEVIREEAKEKLLASESTFVLEGWLPTRQEAALGALLDEFTCAWEIREPSLEEYKGKSRGFRPLAMETKYHQVTNGN